MSAQPDRQRRLARCHNGDGKRGKLRWLRVANLRNLVRNPQYLTPRQLDGLSASISRDGFLAPILVRPTRSGKHEIVSGNHRVMAAKEVGMVEVPCIVIEMGDQEARRAAINLNTVHGDPPAELLAPFLAELDDQTLREIHLEPELLAEILAFDGTLAERLAELEPPGAMNTASPQSEIRQCKCPVCGKAHIRGAQSE